MNEQPDEEITQGEVTNPEASAPTEFGTWNVDEFWFKNLKSSREPFFGNFIWFHYFSSVQFSRSIMSDSLRPHELQHARPPCPSPITNSRNSLKLMSIESMMPSSHLILYRPLLLLSPIPPSIRVFSNESTLCMRWPKYWSFSFSISPSNEYPGLISFRTWLSHWPLDLGQPPAPLPSFPKALH